MAVECYDRMAVGSRARVCALVSGGLDSLLLVHWLLGEGVAVYPLYVRGGLLWESAELWWLRRWLRALRSRRLEPLSVLEVPLRAVYGAHWSLTGRGVPSRASPDRAVYLPGRNVVLVGHAAVYAAQRGVSTVALGSLSGNPFGDATPKFFQRFAGCLSLALSRPIRIIAPLRARTKAEWMAAAKGQPMPLTFSCLRPRGR
ncbi:MAG: 7-cyano-7-deazaguanine synthase, partial [Candidatus Omnitrophica bacterium]|nr:7-cyano-7-deazaguanine synthase [Candidatus Omnitrophota bacterium]